MARVLDQPRYKCAMAAMQTVQSIERALPILHSGSGCAEKLNGSIGSSGYFSPHIFPCTNISEKEVIFGGEDRLRETIDNALKVVDADLYVVLTSCASEIIGDDVEEIVKSFKDAGKPVIYASTPGFKGNNYSGHEWVINAIIEQYLKPSDIKVNGLVNIWAGLPMQDPFWLGNLKTLERLVTELGLTPNTIFGFDRGIKNINKIPQAQFNLLVSPWVGFENVKLLEEKFGTPYLHYPTLPVGAFETSKFLRAVGEFAGIDSEKTERIIVAHEKEYYYYSSVSPMFFLRPA
jgi:nitrogenase molybdenum-iron protein beta chain